jgi:cell division protein ZipA
MTGLRLALLALGLLLILAVYLWSRGVPQRWFGRLSSLRPARPVTALRVEPAVETESDGYAEPDELGDIAEPEPDELTSVSRSSPKPVLPEKVITLRFLPRQGQLPCDTVLLALRAAGLRHGRYGIFHKLPDDFSDEPHFSVANLTEPGSFDLARASETRIPGMSFFMIIPGPADPVDRFDDMVRTARDLARELNGELRDEQGSSWSIQRERFVREEIIQLRHALDRHD